MDPYIERRDAHPTVGITVPVTMSTIALVADRLPGLFGALGSRGIDPAGAPYFRYHVIDMERELLVEVGVPVPDADDPRLADLLAAEPDARAGELPAGRYAVMRHHGHPDGLAEATGRLLEWARDAGVTWDARDTPDGQAWGCRLESYLTDPAEEPDMEEWDTELAFRLAD